MPISILQFVIQFIFYYFFYYFLKMDRFNGKDAVIPISGNFGWKLDKNTGRTIFIRIVKSTKKCVNLAAEHNRIANFSKHFINHERELHLFYEYPMNLGNATRILNNFYKDGLPELAIRLIARNLLEALSYLHSQGIIHRAVCAENIFLNSDGHCRLALTEHAIKIEECPRWMGQQDRVHNFNNLEDVFVWLAPEVLRQDLNGYGTQADVYSFGICLCELANGVAPFSEMEPLQILYEKLRGTTPFLQQEGYSSPGIHNQRCFSQQLHQIVNDSLEIEPLQRPSARQLLDKYGDFLCANSTTFHFGPDELLRTMPMANKLF